MQKVFIVTCHSGSYDDYRAWIDSAWSTEQLANKREQTILAGIERDKQIEDQWSDENGVEIDVENIPDEEYQKRADLEHKKYEATEFGGVKITELILDKIIEQNEN